MDLYLLSVVMTFLIPTPIFLLSFTTNAADNLQRTSQPRKILTERGDTYMRMPEVLLYRLHSLYMVLNGLVVCWTMSINDTMIRTQGAMWL